MSQHTFSIANEAGAAFRADVNSALQALASCSRGTSAPGTTYAGQVWDDTSNNVQKKRNAANAAWIVKATIDETFVLARSSNTILSLSDIGKCIVATSTFTQTLTAAATLGDGWFVDYRNDGTGAITIDPNSSETIDGATTLTLWPGDSARIWCNGSAFKTVGRMGPAVVTEVATTSGTTAEISNIPSTARRISINLVGVSQSNGSGLPMIQFSTGGVYKTSGYNCAAIVATAGTTATSSTFGLLISANSNAAATYHGRIELTLQDASDNTWVVNGQVIDIVTFNCCAVAGSFALSGVLDKVRITTNSADTLDAGVMSIAVG